MRRDVVAGQFASLAEDSVGVPVGSGLVNMTVFFPPLTAAAVSIEVSHDGVEFVPLVSDLSGALAFPASGFVGGRAITVHIGGAPWVRAVTGDVLNDDVVVPFVLY